MRWTAHFANTRATTKATQPKGNVQRPRLREDACRPRHGLQLSYNTTPHSSTGFSPAYLLRGYQPITSSTLISRPAPIERSWNGASIAGGDILVIDAKAQEMAEEFDANRTRAKEALLLAQVFQKRVGNRLSCSVWDKSVIGRVITVKNEFLHCTRRPAAHSILSQGQTRTYSRSPMMSPSESDKIVPLPYIFSLSCLVCPSPPNPSPECQA